MFFGNRRNNYNKIIEEGVIEDASSTSYTNLTGFSVPSSSSLLATKTHLQQNFILNKNKTEFDSQKDLNYMDNQQSSSFHPGVTVTINTGKTSALNRSKQDHRWDHIEDLDQVN